MKYKKEKDKIRINRQRYLSNARYSKTDKLE